MTRITQIIKEARDQGRLTALDYAHGILITLSNYMAIGISEMTVQSLVELVG